MLHELLLALSGHPGYIFVADENSSSIKLVSDLPFIHQSEAFLLERLCKLASGYVKLNDFVQRYGPAPAAMANQREISGTGNVKSGLYIRAFCQGLDDVLNPYRKSLLMLERQLTEDSSLTTAFVQSSLEKYQLLFPALTRLVDDILIQSCHGCGILDLLYKATACGMPDVKESVEHILKVCHTVLYKQLTAWMLYGRLVDDFKEFFIVQRMTSDTDSEPDQADSNISSLNSVNVQLDKILKQMHVEQSDKDLCETFEISAAILPSYIPHQIAQKILFVGESVHMFEQRQNKTRDFALSLLKTKTDEYHRDVKALSQQKTFILINFEEVVDKIRSYIAEELWNLVVVQSHLVATLKVMKEFYLLGRGELFLEFIHLQGNIRQMPEKDSHREINLAFEQAARNVLFDNERLLKQFRFTLQSPKSDDISEAESTVSVKAASQRDVSVDLWTRLRMNYTVAWPLHIFFTPSVLARYNSLFVFLLHVKRIQQELHQCWTLQMQRRHQRCNDSHSSSKWWLRNHMAFLVNNLQYYLQVDVIESHFSVLLASLEATHDFEAVRHAHDCFLSSLQSHCFIQSRQISRCLYEILNLCHRFCGLMQYSEVVLSEPQMQQVEEISKNFQRHSSLLFAMLSGVRNHQTNPHLAQLLLRVDFNRYFSTVTSQITGGST